MSLSPMMQQYSQIKEQHKDALLFFRLGDFYELFFEDAKIASKELEITLTGRDCGIGQRAPMCGVPHHAAQSYIVKLIQKGYKVAICEQTQAPEDAKGIVERNVVRIITPGTITEPSALDEKKNNYLASIFNDNLNFGLSVVDITTGEFLVSEITGLNSDNALVDELSRLNPTEIIINENMQLNQSLLRHISTTFAPCITPYQEWAYNRHTAYQKLTSYFSVHSLGGYGCEEMKHGICAAGALLEYITQTQKDILRHINHIKTYYPCNYMMLDAVARRNLELTESTRDRSKKGSLLWILDNTNTAIGGRMLRKWLQQPLLDIPEIENRQQGVKEFFYDPILMGNLKELLVQIYDLERLAAKISCNTANARDLLALKQSLKPIPMIKKLLNDCSSAILDNCHAKIDSLEDIYELIERSIMPDPSPLIKDGRMIKEGYSQQLDQYREAMTKGRNWIAELEQQEKEKTGIKSLKTGYNKVFGYYIEITKSYYEMVPDYFIRKQTLANCERFITLELKEMEATILGAEDKSIRLEYELFICIREEISRHLPRIQSTANIIGILDVLWSLARAAVENNYVCPKLTDDGSIDIRNGRHPVVEKTLPHNLFVSNNVHLNVAEERLMIITGPNMAGKSTYLRQVAIIAIMAQMGSFVPASEAHIGIIDRIFTRVGASDDLFSGQSTFMVEMNEVANILHNATPKSLLILDEIGRGTSTFDGLSIAWSVIEYISNNPSLRCKTLFATHYHELTELEGKLPGVKNYCISVKEEGDDIIFLRKIARGGADKSFGIQVARLAGLPLPVIERAGEILSRLEEADINNINRNAKRKTAEQLSLFVPQNSEIEDELASLDVSSITPMDAINLLFRLVNKANSKSNRGKRIV